MEIRQLGPDDEALFTGMLTMFGEAFAEPHTFTGPSAAYRRRLLSRDTFFALVAVEREKVIGGLAAYVLDKFEQERSEVYIYDLAVAEPHRRRGIATALIERLKPLAAARGAWVIFVQADPGDDPAIALYTKLGVREDVHHFDIPVTASSSAPPSPGR